MRRRYLGASAGVVLACSVAACSQSVDLAPDAAGRLQAAVGDVVVAAEEGRYDAAEQAVVRARALLDDAADEGRLSVARYRVIDDALSRTEAELAAAAQAAASATASSAPTAPTTEVAQPAAPAPAPAAPPGNGKDPADTGHGPGKGHGRR